MRELQKILQNSYFISVNIKCNYFRGIKLINQLNRPMLCYPGAANCKRWSLESSRRLFFFSCHFQAFNINLTRSVSTTRLFQFGMNVQQLHSYGFHNAVELLPTDWLSLNCCFPSSQSFRWSAARVGVKRKGERSRLKRLFGYTYLFEIYAHKRTSFVVIVEEDYCSR